MTSLEFEAEVEERGGRVLLAGDETRGLLRKQSTILVWATVRVNFVEVLAICIRNFSTKKYGRRLCRSTGVFGD